MPSDPRVGELVQELRSVFERIQGDEVLDVEVSEQLMSRIQGIVPQVAEEDVALLKSELDLVVSAVAERHAALAQELKHLRQSRKGLDGYNHIRGHDTEQRLSRTA